MHFVLLGSPLTGLTGERACLVESPRMTWIPSDGPSPSLNRIRRFCGTNCWRSFNHLGDVGALPELKTEIDQFRYCHLDSPIELLAFTKWLQSNHPDARPLVTNLISRFITKVTPSNSGIPPVRNWIANTFDRKLVAENGHKVSWARELPDVNVS